MKETAATQYFFEPGISQIMLFFCTWQPPLWPYCPYVSPSSERNSNVTVSSLNSAFCSSEQIGQCGANLDIYLCSNCFTWIFFLSDKVLQALRKRKILDWCSSQNYSPHNLPSSLGERGKR